MTDATTAAWKPRQYEPNRAEKCANPYGAPHADGWSKGGGWCGLCGQSGVSEPAIWYALADAYADVERLERELEIERGEYELVGHEGTEEDDPQVVARYAAEARAQQAQASEAALREALEYIKKEGRRLAGGIASDEDRTISYFAAKTLFEKADAALEGKRKRWRCPSCQFEPDELGGKQHTPGCPNA